jgi:hypothetical protein
MLEMNGCAENLAAIAEETAALEARRLKALADIGEKALPELRGNPAYAELAEAADEIEGSISALRVREAELLAKIEQLEKEEKERIAKLTCYSCKMVNADDSRFCERCGAKLGEPPREYCVPCGTMNQPSMKFCGECGSKLG